MHYHCFTCSILLERINSFWPQLLKFAFAIRELIFPWKKKSSHLLTPHAQFNWLRITKIDQNLWLNVKDLIIWADDSILDECWFSLSLYAHRWYILIWKLKCTLTNQPAKKKTAIVESKPSCSRRVTLVKERVSQRSSNLAGEKEIDRKKEKNAEKELTTVCSKEIKPPATINFFPFFCAVLCVLCRPQKSMDVFFFRYYYYHF